LYAISSNNKIITFDGNLCNMEKSRVPALKMKEHRRENGKGIWESKARYTLYIIKVKKS